MKSFVFWLDRKTPLMLILLVFWSLFWVLNGADKFLDGEAKVNFEYPRSVLVDEEGKQRYTVFSIEPQGVYGVSRESKMIGYFNRLHLPKEAAIVALYGFAVLELLLGMGFAFLVLWSLLPKELREREDGIWEIFSSRAFHRLCFKGGIFIFLAFSVGDILFGDRMELWEHGTFMLLTLVTYDLWYRTDCFVNAKESESASN